MSAAERHEHQHQLIAERADAYAAAPKRSGRDKYRRRELSKRAWWTLTVHMRSMHSVGGQNPFLFKTYAEVSAWHDRLHAEAQS